MARGVIVLQRWTSIKTASVYGRLHTNLFLIDLKMIILEQLNTWDGLLDEVDHHHRLDQVLPALYAGSLADELNEAEQILLPTKLQQT